MKPAQIHSGFGYQRRQLGNEIQGIKDHMRRPIPIGCLQSIANLPV